MVHLKEDDTKNMCITGKIFSFPMKYNNFIDIKTKIRTKDSKDFGKLKKKIKIDSFKI
jgi:hypothetical protein